MMRSSRSSPPACRQFHLNPRAILWSYALLKPQIHPPSQTRARWREGLAADDSVPSADAGSNSEVILTLPDNNRDPELTQVLRDAQQKYFAGKRQRQQPAASDA